MATMQLIGVKWIKIFAGDTMFPILRIVVDPGDGVAPEGFAESVWRASAGMVLASCFRASERIATQEMITFSESGNITYGDNNGWSVLRANRHVTRYAYSALQVSYKGTLLNTDGQVAGAFSNYDFHVGIVSVITDTEGHIYPQTSSPTVVGFFDPIESFYVTPSQYCTVAVPDTTTRFLGVNPSISLTFIPDVDIEDISQEIASDPYEFGVGPSEPGGYGDGTFDFSSTPIDFQGLPGIGAMDTGMVSLYVPSASDLRGLAQYLWAGAFDVDNFKKLVADPMDTIIGMHIVPLTAAQIGTTASTLVVGNISTGISMPKAISQYVAVDCGSITIDRKWGAYLDYSPYSKLQLFLPYIGFVDISPDDCMGGTIAVRYSIDILGGTCVAQVKCNDHVLYELSGNCSCEVPVTAGQYQNIALSLTRGIGAIAGGIASGNYAGSVEGVANAALSAVKPEVQRSGGFGGSSGLMGHQIPFLVLTVPRMCVPGSQNTYIGYPSFITRTMDELEGYNSVEVTHLEGMSCTQAEADMIIAALAEGVIF